MGSLANSTGSNFTEINFALYQFSSKPFGVANISSSLTNEYLADLKIVSLLIQKTIHSNKLLTFNSVLHNQKCQPRAMMILFIYLFIN
jgi:hypothetical protein